MNQMIRIPQVRVVDEEGAQLGVMPTARALELALERGLDLVEVAATANPPVQSTTTGGPVTDTAGAALAERAPSGTGTR